jgi:hypothetical protein
MEGEDMKSWWNRLTQSERDHITKGAVLNQWAAELQMVAGGKGRKTSDIITIIATALANEVVAFVERNPGGITVAEMLDMTCDTVREMASYSANPSPDAPKEAGDLTEREFAQLTMRIVHTATQDTTVTDAVSATAKALGTMIAITARRPNTVGFDEILRWGQNAVVTFARDARSKAQA